MGFLISINGADFNHYSQSVESPHRYSYVSDPEASWAISRVNKETQTFQERPSSSQVEKANFKNFKKSIHKLNETHNLKKAVIAKHVMSQSVVTVHMEETLLEAELLMSQHSIHHLPVLDDEKKLIGMISDRDLLKYSNTTGKLTPTLTVGQGMTAKVFAATYDTLLFEVAHLMLDEKISALPILGARKNLIGILTTTDILKGLVKRAPIELWV